MTIAHDARIEPHGDLFIVSNPAVGAISAMTDGDLVAFHLFSECPDDPEPLIRFYASFGMDDGVAKAMADTFRGRMDAEGWTRTSYPEVYGDALSGLYLT